MNMGGMKNFEEHIWDEATRWFMLAEYGDLQAEQWEELIQWLEADPAHRKCYDVIANSDQGLDDLAPPMSVIAEKEALPIPANDNRKWFAAALTAVLIFAVFLSPQWLESNMQLFETSPGETREIALRNGTVIMLNGDSKAEIDMSGQRSVKLLQGEAAFTVTHNEEDPFTVDLGNVQLVDAGTVFNVFRENDDFSVAVAEGLVILNPERQAVSIQPGDAVRGRISDLSFKKSSVEIEGIGSWREGRLIFNDHPLTNVATALSRNLGRVVTVDPSHADVRFTGAISLDGSDDVIMKRVEGLSGMPVMSDGEGWKIGQ